MTLSERKTLDTGNKTKLPVYSVCTAKEGNVDRQSVGLRLADLLPRQSP